MSDEPTLSDLRKTAEFAIRFQQGFPLFTDLSPEQVAVLDLYKMLGTNPLDAYHSSMKPEVTIGLLDRIETCQALEEYLGGLLDLKRLGTQAESPFAEVVRGRMDQAWAGMTQHQRLLVGAISGAMR